MLIGKSIRFKINNLTQILAVDIFWKIIGNDQNAEERRGEPATGRTQSLERTLQEVASAAAGVRIPNFARQPPGVLRP
jgi:hypothetical protein